MEEHYCYYYNHIIIIYQGARLFARLGNRKHNDYKQRKTHKEVQNNWSQKLSKSIGTCFKDLFQANLIFTSSREACLCVKVFCSCIRLSAIFCWSQMRVSILKNNLPLNFARECVTYEAIVVTSGAYTIHYTRTYFTAMTDWIIETQRRRSFEYHSWFLGVRYCLALLLFY